MDYIRFQKRIGQVKKYLNSYKFGGNHQKSAFIVSSAPTQHQSRDQDFPLRQNSDFLYLTGSDSSSLILIIESGSKPPVLIGTSRSKEQAVWEGPGVNFKLLAKNLGCSFIDVPNPEQQALNYLATCHTLFHSSEPNTLALKVARTLFEIPSHKRANKVKSFVHADTIMEPLRLTKDNSEVQAIIEANLITNSTLHCLMPFVKSGQTEAALAAFVEYSFKAHGAENAFQPIVACGKNAATLHHRSSESKLKKGDMLLLDIGARKAHYNADITRVVSIETGFSLIQKELYDIVLSAQKAAIAKVKSGVLVKSIHEAAVRELSIGLKDLGVIRASLPKILKDNLYKPYFPHGIGHTLGIDVHDIGAMRSDSSTVLKAGMVITIEPGIYFPKSIKNIPACGIRIEDNLLVTNGKPRILSAGFPK